MVLREAHLRVCSPLHYSSEGVSWMDPDKALAEFREAYRLMDKAKDPEMEGIHAVEAAEKAAELFEWLAMGGFAPKWSEES